MRQRSGCGHSGVGMIFGLQPIACALDLSQNTALLLFFVEEAAKGQ